MKCNNAGCSLTLDDSWSFCPHCGQPICCSQEKNTDNYADDSELCANARTLEEIFEEFGVETTCTGVQVNADSVTYEVLPGVGVRLERIKELRDNIALGMRAYRVRIQTPIPGKGVCGIEVSDSPMNDENTALTV